MNWPGDICTKKLNIINITHECGEYNFHEERSKDDHGRLHGKEGQSNGKSKYMGDYQQLGEKHQMPTYNMSTWSSFFLMDTNGYFWVQNGKKNLTKNC